MKLEFDSIHELEQFFMFSAHIGQAFTAQGQGAQVQPPVQRVDSAADFYAPPAEMDKATVSDNGASSAPSALSGGEPAGAETDVDDAATPSASGADTAPKRKRRTKAEIAADEAAALQARGDSGELAAAATQALENGEYLQRQTYAIDAPANPFAQSLATQAILEAPTHAASLAAAGEAMQRPLEEPDMVMVEVSGIEHLRACQSFIQAYGMHKYNESFRDGLNANIATYTAEQRAQHVGVLSTLGV